MRAPSGRLESLAAHAALFAFPGLWLLCAGLAQIHLLEIQQPWSTAMLLVVAVVPVAYVLGGLVGREFVRARVSASSSTRPGIPFSTRKRLRWVLLGCAVIGNLEQAHQFAAAHTIPLFSSQIDEARFGLPGGPTIILTDLLTVAAVVSLVLPRRLIARDALPELAIAAFALSGFALAAGRGAIIQAAMVVLVARWLYYGRLPLRALALVGVVVLVFSIGVFHLRTSQHANDALSVELREDVYPGMPRPVQLLVPADLALATNMEALARIVDYFPAVEPYGRGAYGTYGFDLFLPSARNLQLLSGRLSPPWVTSTVAGTFWADGGLPLVVAGLALIGAVVVATDFVARARRELRFALLAGNFLFLALFGVYVNLWTQQVDWILITPLLYVLGAVAEGFDPIPRALRASFRTPGVLLSLLRR